jgi:hypothetical protein
MISTEKFDVTVNGETYTVNRVLEDSNGKVNTYGFTTVIDGREMNLSAKFSTVVDSDLHAQYGISVLNELTNTLLNEFQLEISKIKETQ